MTPAEHYAEAEKILARLHMSHQDARAGELALAQVHATLSTAQAPAHSAMKTQSPYDENAGQGGFSLRGF